MKLSLKLKVTLVLVLLVTVVMGLITFFNVRQQVRESVEQKKQEATLVGRIFGLNYSSSLLTGADLDEINRTSTRLWLETAPGAEFLIAYDVEGNDFFYMPEDVRETETDIIPFPPEQIKNLLRSQRDVFGRWAEEENFYDALVPIRYHDNEFGVIRIGFDTTALAERQRAILINNAVVTGIFWIVAIIVGIFATTWFLKPLEKLDEVAVELGRGNLDVRSDIKTGDEIEELGDVFNNMADRIQARIKERERSLAQLEAIQRVGSRLNESTEPEVFFPVLDEALQTLYDIEVFIPVIWDGELYTAPYTRPELDSPLFIPSHSPPIEPLDNAPKGEYTSIEPGEDWPEALQDTNTAYPFKVGIDLHGALYMKLNQDISEQEANWMAIWGTQVCQAVRGMVLDEKIEEYQSQLVKAQEDLLKKKLRAGYTDFLLASIPEFVENRKEAGIFYGEDFYDQLLNTLNNLDFDTDIIQLQADRFLIMGADLDDWDKKEVESVLTEFPEAKFEFQWCGDEEPDATTLQNFTLEI